MSAAVVLCWETVTPAARTDRITEELKELPSGERTLLSSRATWKRRAEFCAGRRAARRAVAAVLGSGTTGIALLPETGETAGRPAAFADGRGIDGLCVSISHAGARAVAAAGRRPLGVDLVTIEPFSPPFHEEAFLPGEVEAASVALGAPSRDAAASAMFACKEAALKIVGSGLRRPVLGLRIDLRQGPRLAVDCAPAGSIGVSATIEFERACLEVAGLGAFIDSQVLVLLALEPGQELTP